MKITSLVENTSNCNLPVEHGLSLYIELDSGFKILFDMGQGELFAENSRQLGLSIEDVDMAIISHGHYDHGGGLETFLKLNSKAKVYIHQKAFEPHYSLKDTGMKYIGLNDSLAQNSRLVLCNNLVNINANIQLFANVEGEFPAPLGNKLLYGPSKSENDSFVHEQNLLIREGSNLVLFAGCAHRGIINIIRRAKEIAGSSPTYVFAGMHLSADREMQSINNLAKELQAYPNTRYYTMHCTGTAQYNYLHQIMGEQIGYLSSGESVAVQPHNFNP